MKPATVVAVILLALVAIGHLLRFVFGIEVIIAGKVIPMWVSAAAFLVAGGVGVGLWRENRGR